MSARIFSLLLLAAASLAGSYHAGAVSAAGQPIPGAEVRATQGDRKLVTSTDEQGLYILGELTPGVWTLEVEIFGFKIARRQLTVGSEPTSLNWELEMNPSAGAERERAQGEGPESEIEEAEEGEEAEAAVPAELAYEPFETNEAFLVNGSLSAGLAEVPREDESARPLRDWEQRLEKALAERAEQDGGVERKSSLAKATGIKGRAGTPRPARAPRSTKKSSPKIRAAGRKAVNFGNRSKKVSDRLRGSAYWTLRDSALDARPYSLSGLPAPKPDYGSSRFGVSLGGPLHIPGLIESDRTFLYFNYTGSRGHNPYNAISTLPGLLERNGDFSQSITRGPVTIFDPLTGRPFAENRLPAARWNPQATGLLEFIPRPTEPGQVQNYHFLSTAGQDSDALGVRFSQSLSRRDRFSFSFNRQAKSGDQMQPFGFRDSSLGRNLTSDLNWTMRLGRRITNNLRWNFSRTRQQVVPFFAYKRNVAQELGIRGTSQEPINYGPPNLSFTNFGNLTDASPVLRRDQSAGLGEGLTIVHGRHTFQAGAEYRRNQLNSRTDQNARGTFTFSGLLTSGLDARGNPLPGTGFDFADFLLGLPQSSSLRFGGSNTYFRESVSSAFLQDEWRARPGLSLNLGLRYDYFSPFREKYGRMANLDLAPGFTGAAVVTPGQAGPYTGPFPETLIDPDRNNFAPRLGIAWRPQGRNGATVRAGYGWYYNGSIYNQFATRLASQPPFANTGTQSTSLAHPLTLENGFASAPTQKITNTYAVDRFYRVGYAQTWSLSIQKELAHSLVGEFGYLGTKGTRLDIQRHPNRAPPGSPLTAEQRRRIGNAVGFTFESSEGNSIYHAAQLRLTRRLRKGMSATAHYTWGKSIDNASTFGGGGNTVAQNDQDLRSERGLSSFDQRHLFNLTYYLASPFGEGGSFFPAHGWGGRILRDWALSGGLTLRSGTPFTARVLGNRADSGGTGVVGSGRADATGLPVRGPGGRFFRLDAFTLPPSGRYGNAGRNTVPGRPFFSLDLSLGRSFRLGSDQQRRLELRLESSNLTNYVSYSRLATVVNARDYGLATAAAPMRTLRATLRFRF